MGQPNEISIIGSGNVAFKLGEAFHSAGIKIKEILGRNSVDANELAIRTNSRVISDLNQLSTDLVLLCVSDDQVASLLQRIPENKKVAYTAGSIAIEECGRNENVGVFYPLQTLRKDQALQSRIIPILVESTNIEFKENLFFLGNKISSKVMECSSTERIHYHLAAVWLNNFTNHMVTVSQRILEEHALDFDLLHPLLQETSIKLLNEDTFDSQTGPARRGDDRILELHKSLLDGTRKEVYEMISKSISETYFTK